MSTIKTQIKSTNFELTGEIEEYVREKIFSLEKYLKIKEDTEIIAQVELKKVAGEHHRHGEIFRSEINFEYEGKLYRAEKTEEDIFSAIEGSGREMVREITEAKEKRKDLVRRGGAAIKKWLRFGKEE